MEGEFVFLTPAQIAFVTEQQPPIPQASRNVLLTSCLCVKRFNGPAVNCPVCMGYGWVPSREGMKVVGFLSMLGHQRVMAAAAKRAKEEKNDGTDDSDGSTGGAEDTDG